MCVCVYIYMNTHTLFIRILQRLYLTGVHNLFDDTHNTEAY